MKKWHIIGLMSGTSLDGVDIVYAAFEENTTYSFKILHAKTYPYPPQWKAKLQQAFLQKPDNLKALDKEYGAYLGQLINRFTESFHIENIDFVASHGHTIFHKPEEGFTLQIGDGSRISNVCKQTVVCDFRSQDVALGGQGAPLVPIGDQLLFSEYDYCLNIGGFANVSYDENGVRKAFDICPANIVLNHYTRSIHKEYDDKGKMAQSGKLQEELLLELNNLTLYQSKNALGNETVVADFIPLIDRYKLEIPDILHTYVEHIAIKIAAELRENSRVLVTGGGGYNTYLISRIKQHSKAQIILPGSGLIDYKEALIFAFLGLLRMEDKNNCLASVTGASKDHSSGVIFYPENA